MSPTPEELAIEQRYAELNDERVEVVRRLRRRPTDRDEQRLKEIDATRVLLGLKSFSKEPKMHKEFAVHMLSDAGKERARAVAQEFDELLSALEAICPPGRELALVRTKLEEACFFAKKSLTSNPENLDSAAPE